MGISISSQRYHVQGFKDDVIKFLIYDLAGQSFFKRVRREYYTGANCAFIVYDVTRRESFDEATNFWLKDAQKELGNIPFVLIGNKADLIEDVGLVIDRDEARSFAENEGSIYIETSAKTGVNVDEAFTELTRKIIDSRT